MRRQKLFERCSNSARNWIGKTITEETAAELAHAFYIEACTEWEVRQQDFKKLYNKKIYTRKTLNRMKQHRQDWQAGSDVIDQLAATIGAMQDLLRRLRKSPPRGS